MSIGNWGRWGENDERGSLNLLDSNKILESAGYVKDGKVFSLGLPIQQKNVPIFPGRNPMMHFMTVDGGDFAAGARSGAGNVQHADDYIALATHGTTHIDALAHFWADHQMYNGYSGNLVRSSGARKNGIQNVEWIVSKGVLLDIAAYFGVNHLENGYEITAEDLQGCAEKEGVTIGTGDVVLIRTGWLNVFYQDPDEFYKGEPGIGMEAAKYLAQKDICAVGADNVAVEVQPDKEGKVFPVHVELLRNHGIYLMEMLVLDQLAQSGHYEFMFVAAPLKIVRGVGSPINPLAIV